jgi:hypothetical protein
VSKQKCWWVVRYPSDKQVRETYFSERAAMERLVQLPAREEAFVYTPGCNVITPDEAQHRLADR